RERRAAVVTGSRHNPAAVGRTPTDLVATPAAEPLLLRNHGIGEHDRRRIAVRHRRHFDQSGTEPTTAGTSRRRASGPAGKRSPTGHRSTTRTTLWSTAGSTTRHTAGHTARNARGRRPERTVVTVLAVLR